MTADFIDERLFGLRVPGALFIFLAAVFLSTCSRDIGANPSLNPERNRNALERAKSNIEKHRKGSATITLLGDAKEATVRVRQISHDFKFGCYFKLDDLDTTKLKSYEQAFAGLFNYAVVGTYWDFVEPVRGEANWTWLDRELAAASALGLRSAAAPVLWGSNRYGTPRWLPRDAAELRRVVGDRVAAALRHSGIPEDWEIVNEPLGPKGDLFAARLGQSYIDSAFRTGRAAAPNKRLMINEFGFFGSNAKNNFNKDRYFDLLIELLSRGVPIDVIGMQAHSNGEWFEPSDVAETLTRYASLGKPIQITEFSVQTRDYRDKKTPLAIGGRYRGGVWSDDLQAEFYREFYTIAFGEPRVEAIVTWGLDEERAWLPGIGLIDRDGEPKANYLALWKLINDEWRTDLELTLSNNVPDEFRGFYGRYEITSTVNGKVFKKTVELGQNSGNNWVIEL